jgi:hypothetical protein
MSPRDNDEAEEKGWRRWASRPIMEGTVLGGSGDI